MHHLTFFPHSGVRLWRSVVVSAKPIVERDITFAIIALEITMVQFVMQIMHRIVERFPMDKAVNR